MSSYTHTKIYENGPFQFLEHHQFHGETKTSIESCPDISFLTDHFFCESFNLSLVTMIITETDDEVGHIQLGNTRVQEAEQLPEREHQNYERNDMAIPVDLNLYRSHRTSTRSNLSSLVDSHTSSGFNSLTVYDHNESSLTSYLAIGRNDVSITSATSGQQNIHRSASSGYLSGRRRSVAASGSFSFSHQLQADRPIIEEEQNHGYTDDNIDNIIDPHASCSICSQYLGQQAQQILPPSSPIFESAIFSLEHDTRENRLASGENTSTVSLHESTLTSTQLKKIQSSEETSSRSDETPPDDNSHQHVALATTRTSSRPRPRDQPRMLERSTSCNDSSSNGSREECPLWSCSRSLQHDMYNNRVALKGPGKRAAQYDTTESICKADESNDCCHRNSNHYGSFDRIQRNGNIMHQG